MCCFLTLPLSCSGFGESSLIYLHSSQSLTAPQEPVMQAKKRVLPDFAKTETLQRKALCCTHVVM